MKPQEVSDAWSRYFVRDNRVVGIFIPDDQPRRAQMSPTPSLDEVLSKYEFKAEGQEAEVFDSSAANLNARTERDEKVMKLTLEEVNAAFRKMVNCDKLTVILAGDQKKAMTQE